MPTLTHAHTLTFTCSVVNTVAFHPEGQCLASGSADRTLKMWDVRSHLLIQHYPAHDDEVTSISMHPVSECVYLSMCQVAWYSIGFGFFLLVQWIFLLLYNAP